MIFVNSMIHVDEELTSLSLISLRQLCLDLLLLLAHCLVVVGVIETIHELDLPLSLRYSDSGRLGTALLLSGDELGLNSIIGWKCMLSRKQKVLSCFTNRG